MLSALKEGGVNKHTHTHAGMHSSMYAHTHTLTIKPFFLVQIHTLTIKPKSLANSHYVQFYKLLPVSMINELSEQLDGRLGAIHLLGRHVEVVNKDDGLLAHLRAKHSFPPLVQLGHDDVLNKNIAKCSSLGQRAPELPVLHLFLNCMIWVTVCC